MEWVAGTQYSRQALAVTALSGVLFFEYMVSDYVYYYAELTITMIRIIKERILHEELFIDWFSNL